MFCCCNCRSIGFRIIGLGILVLSGLVLLGESYWVRVKVRVKIRVRFYPRIRVGVRVYPRVRVLGLGLGLGFAAWLIILIAHLSVLPYAPAGEARFVFNVPIRATVYVFHPQ